MFFIHKILKDIYVPNCSFTPGETTILNKKTGKVKKRKITIQSPEMEKVHDRLKVFLRRQKVISLESATGGKKGGSCQKDILRHRRMNRLRQIYFPPHFFVSDCRKAFDSVPLHKLALILAKLDPREKIDTVGLQLKFPFGEYHKGNAGTLQFLQRFCQAESGGLATGAGSCTDLFNLYCAATVDVKLRAYCKKHDITYTRYIDDVTFSSNTVIGTQKRRFMRKIFSEAGLPLDDKKSAVFDLRKCPAFIHGVGIDKKGNIFTKRDFTRSLQGLLHTSLQPNAVIEARTKRVALGKANIFLQNLKANGRSFNNTEQKVLKDIERFRIKSGYPNKRKYRYVRQTF